MPIEIWPVIHVVTEPQVRADIDVVRASGLKQAMLISMRGDDDFAALLGAGIKMLFPDMLVGVNRLRMPTSVSVERNVAGKFDATWSDRQDFMRGVPLPDADVLFSERGRLQPPHKVFAAVAFKGQPVDTFPGNSARTVAYRGMIPTTSGCATGVAVPALKLVRMRSQMEPQDPLAVASGVTPDNLHSIKPYITHVLVNTGISVNGKGEYLDPVKLRALVEAAA